MKQVRDSVRVGSQEGDCGAGRNVDAQHGDSHNVCCCVSIFRSGLVGADTLEHRTRV